MLNKQIKRLLSLVMAWVMVFSLFPVSTYAEDTEPTENTTEETQTTTAPSETSQPEDNSDPTGETEASTEPSEEATYPTEETEASKDAEDPLADVRAEMDDILLTYLGTTVLTEDEIIDIVSTMFWDDMEKALERCNALEPQISMLTEDEIAWLEENYPGTDTIVCFYETLQLAMTPGFFAATGNHTPIEGLTVGVKSATDNSMSSGVITVTRQGTKGLWGLGAKSYTANLTFTNGLDTEAKLKFDWAGSFMGTFTFNGTSSSATSGSCEAVIAAGGSINGSLTSQENDNVTSLTMTNFSLVSTTASNTLTVLYDSTLGSVTAGGGSIANNGTVTVGADGITLEATPADGLSFVGWVNVANNEVISHKASYTMVVPNDITVKAVFSSSAMFTVGGVLYEGLNAAVSVAQSGSEKTVVLANNGTLPSGDYTILSGVTLLIPFDDGNTLVTNGTENLVNTYDATARARSQYRKMTMDSNAIITVASGGAISIGSNRANQLLGQVGPYGAIQMENGSNITVASGGTLYAWGYIFHGENGSGTVTVQNGGTVYEPMSIMDYPGSASNTDTAKSAGAFPLRSYSIRNVEVPMTLHVGAKEYTFSCVYGDRIGTHPIYVLLIASEAANNETPVFQFSDSITKSYTNSRMCLNINGNMALNPLTVKLSTSLYAYELKTSELSGFYIPSCYDMIISSGTTTLNDNVIMCEGATMTIASNAFVNTNSKNIYILDADDDPDAVGNTALGGVAGGIYNACSGNINVQDVHGNYYTYVNEDAMLDVNGTLTTTSGFYTSTNGAAIISSKGTGVIEVSGASESTSISVKKTADSANVSITPAQLKNADGTYLATAGATTETTYNYCATHGLWYTGECANCKPACTHANTEIQGKVDATCTSDGFSGNTVCLDCGEIIETGSEISSTGHSYSSTVTAPTCTDEGFTTYTCTACGDSYTADEVAALGHSWVDATCTAPQTCSVCGATEGEALGHSWTDATCTDPKTCSVCGATEDEALGHSWVDATCTDPKTCSVCGATEGEALGHTWTDATCTDPKTCSVCGKTEGSATGVHTEPNAEGKCDVCGADLHTHSYTESITKEPTCTEEGVKTFTCSCKDSYTEAIAKNPNNHASTELTWSKTETQHSAVHKCCNTSAVATEDHEWTDGVCSECSYVCGHTDTDENHTCDICGKTVSQCADKDKNHDCDLTGCAKQMGTCADDNKDHYCDYGAETEGGCANYFGTHADGDDTNHTCDYCGGAVEGDVCTDADNDGDHKCDECEKESITSCGDASKDHICDSDSACDVYSTGDNVHADSDDANHTCDYCGSAVEGDVCVDSDRDHKCDECEAEMGKHEDTNNDHACDYGCSVTIGTCEDTDKDHACDYGCNKVYGEHTDADKNHTCDYGCSVEDFGAHEDKNSNHTCDYGCIETIGEHKDSPDDTDHICDYCKDSAYVLESCTSGAVQKENEKAATCTAEGSYDNVIYCTVCKAELSRNTVTVEKTAHAYDAVVTAPTCTEAGYTTYTCTACGDTYTADEVAALGHKYEAVVTAPTCTEAGYTTYTCTACGDTYTDDEVAALGHSYNTVVTKPTFDAEGYTTHTCSVCKHSYTDSYVDKLIAVAQIGDTRYESLEDAIAAAEDGDTVILLKDTTVADSVVIGKNITLNLNGKTLSAANTLSSKPVIRVLAEVTVKGGIVDGTTGTNSYALIVGNSDTFGQLTIADGTYKGVTSVISITKGTANISGGRFETGHDNEGTDYGSKYLLNCMDAAYKDGSAKYIITGGEFVGFNPMNNEAEGKNTNFLDDSRHAVDDDKDGIYTIGVHTAGETVVENNVAPTCTEEGSYDNVVYCTVCKAELNRNTVTVEKIAHAYDAVVTAPTCTETGYTTYTCTACGDSYVDDEVAAKGHTEGEAVEENNVAPGFDTEGHYDTVVYCSVCNAELSRVTTTIPARVAVAEVNGTKYESITEAVTNAQTGDVVILLKDTTVTDSVVIGKNITLNLNKKTLSAANTLSSKPVIRVLANVTVTNGTVDGTTGTNSYAFIVGNSDTTGQLTITDGTYRGVTSVISISKGTANISGGRFETGHDNEGTDYGSKYLLNCMDAAYKDGSAKYIITGGEFIGFNPMNNEAEGKNTNFLDKDHHAVADDENVYTIGVHTAGETVVENNIDPDCTNKGSYDNVVYCTVCDAELSRETIAVDALGHTEGAVAVENEVAATCTAKGSYDNVVYCSVCNKELSRNTVTVEKAAHTPAAAVVENRVESTCTVAGSYDEVIYCSVCNTELSRETKALELAAHTEGAVVVENEVAATCTAEGKYDNVIYCTTCNAELSCNTVTVEKLPHTPAEAVKENEVASTCTVAGSYDEVIKCSACGEELSRETKALELAAHAKGAVVVENNVAPTCTTAGSYDNVTYCTACGVQTSREIVPVDALKHEEVPHEAKTPTCNEIGWDAYVTCTRCDYSSYVEKPATGHDYVGVVTTEPTCTEKGVKTYTCQNDASHTYTEDVDALDHEYVDHEAKAATCTEIGWDAYQTCSACDYTSYKELPATGNHSYDDGIVSTAPTCIKAGVKTFTCSVCGGTKTEAVDATGEHNWTDGTCTECGKVCEHTYVDGKCEVCGASAETGRITDNLRTLSLEGVIYINQYVLVEGFDGIDSAYIQKNGGMLIWNEKLTEEQAVFGYGNPDVNEGLVENIQTSGQIEYMARTDGIVVKKYADELYLRVYLDLGDGNYAYGPLVEYSVQDYCEGRLKNSSNEKLKNTCAALLHFGAAAQIYFDYNVEDLANANILDEWPVYELDNSLIDLPTTPATNIVQSNSVKNNGRTLSLDSAIVINYYFAASFTPQSAELLFWEGVEGELKPENATSITALTRTESNEYHAQSRAFAAKEYGTTIYACARFVDEAGNVHYSNVEGFSPEAYAYGRLENSSNQKLKDTVSNMVVYGEFAKIYFTRS